MLDLMSESTALVLIGFLGGAVLGLAARLGRFCTLGAIEDYHYGGSSLRLRMWGVALGTAIAAVFLLDAFGLVALTESFYLATSANLVAAAVGGLTFGIGMALSGNCGFGALARLGGGEMRSFVIVLVMGLAAMATLSGPLAELRLTLFPPGDPVATPAGLAHGLATILPLGATALGLIFGLAILAFSAWRAGGLSVLWGLPVGAAIASGYWGTSYVAANGFDPVPVMSHNFSAPMGETMLYIMLSSGLSPGFGVGSVIGVLVGAFAGSSLRGVFRWEACDDYRELRRQIGGAVLMGIGAVVAVGCSVGQGLSAFAALAYTAPVALGAIWLGAILGLRFLIEGRILWFSRVEG